MSELRRYRQWQPGEFVLCFGDTAWGGVDYCAAQFLSHTKLDVPLVYHKRTIGSEMTPQLHYELERIFDATGVPPVVALERNNGGVGELERLQALNRHGKYLIYRQQSNVGTTDITEINQKLGYDTNTATRPQMLSMLKDAIDNRLIVLYDKPTITELFSFVIKQTPSGWKAQAETGAHDDLVMSLAGVWQLYQTEKPTEVFDNYMQPFEQVDLSV